MENKTDQIQNTPSERDLRKGLIAGIILILIGVFNLAAQFIQSEWLVMLFLPGLGLIFLVWGSLARQIGLIIPGGILMGIGAGAYLTNGPLAYLPEQSRGGVFMMVFALGFGLITLLSPFTVRRVHWWPLVPATIMALVGAALFSGETGRIALEFVGKGWPLALIVIGLYMILFRKGIQGK